LSVPNEHVVKSKLDIYKFISCIIAVNHVGHRKWNTRRNPTLKLYQRKQRVESSTIVDRTICWNRSVKSAGCIHLCRCKWYPSCDHGGRL